MGLQERFVRISGAASSAGGGGGACLSGGQVVKNTSQLGWVGEAKPLGLG